MTLPASPSLLFVAVIALVFIFVWLIPFLRSLFKTLALLAGLVGVVVVIAYVMGFTPLHLI